MFLRRASSRLTSALERRLLFVFSSVIFIIPFRISALYKHYNAKIRADVSIPRWRKKIVLPVFCIIPPQKRKARRYSVLFVVGKTAGEAPALRYEIDFSR
jgi:hypothetical protein